MVKGEASGKSTETSSCKNLLKLECKIKPNIKIGKIKICIYI